MIDTKQLMQKLYMERETLAEKRRLGAEALKRLMPIAQGDTGQSSVVARFLLCLYNGLRFPFDMTDLRRLDAPIFEDCLTVLRMDFQLEKEVHNYFPNGGEVFEQLAEDWRVRDVFALSNAAKEIMQTVGAQALSNKDTTVAFDVKVWLRDVESFKAMDAALKGSKPQ